MEEKLTNRAIAAEQILTNLNRWLKAFLQKQDPPLLGADELTMLVALTELPGEDN